MQSSTYTKISNLVNCEIEVTQDFLDYQNFKIKTGNYNSAMNHYFSNFELLEFHLRQKKLIKEPIKWKKETKAWRHDGILDDYFLDFKHLAPRKDGSWFHNVSNKINPTQKPKTSSKQKLEESISLGYLDYFVYYTTTPYNHGQRYALGDKITHRFLNVLSAKDTMEKMKFNFKFPENNNYFYIVKEFNQLAYV